MSDPLLESRTQGSLDSWMSELATVPPWEELLAVTPDERVHRGYGHTLREICQQPVLWGDGAAKGHALREAIDGFMWREDNRSRRPIVLTGSGSSQYAAECVAPHLQANLDVTARAVPAALLLTHPSAYVTGSDPPLVISFARSGDSPESTATVDLLLDRYPGCRHALITCNAAGKLATAYTGDSRVKAIVLDERTNDRSLVMTSSFTNMVIAGQQLGALPGNGQFGCPFGRSGRLFLVARRAKTILRRYAPDLARVARKPFRTACFLGAGAQLGAAREAALKMLEMSAGAVSTIVDTPLGLRHGPMAALRDDSLVVTHLPESPQTRGYTLDVLREIERKRLAGSRVILGSHIPDEFLREDDVFIQLPRVDPMDEDLAAVLDVLVGQILAFFRCMAQRLRPDAPSPGGVIDRVVPLFPLY